jgi:hypothetical protein
MCISPWDTSGFDSGIELIQSWYYLKSLRSLQYVLVQGRYCYWTGSGLVSWVKESVEATRSGLVSWKGAVEATGSGLVSWMKGSVEAAESGLRSWKVPSDCASITSDSFASYVVDVGKLFW